MHIVLATCLKDPALSVSDGVLAKVLEARGASVTSAPWNGPFTAFENADLVVIRTTWDYFDVLEEYYAWFDRLEAAGIATANPPEILRWNAQKDYLFELQEKGAPMIPTVRVAHADDIAAASRQFKWETCVLKCLASGGALGMTLFDPARREEIDRALEAAAPWAAHGMMLQPFVPEILTEGELSIIFIGGAFSHAIRKTPKEGEIRIQSEYGGKYTPIDLPSEIITTAADILALAPGVPGRPSAYARVDGIVVEGRFLLMELEMTEPELMFDFVPEAAERMADFLLRDGNER